MSTTGNTAPNGTGEDRGPILFISSIVFGALSLLVVSLRIGYRLSKKTLAISDLCIVIAMSLNLVHSITNCIAVSEWGWGQHELDLPKTIRNAPQGLLYFWFAQLFSKPCLLFAKLSLFFVYRGLFKTADTAFIRLCRALNNFTAFLVVTYYSAALLATVFQCTPVDKSWHPLKLGTCINKATFFYTTGTVSVVTSLLVIFTPLPVLFRTKQNRTEVTQLLGLILLGLVDTITSVVRMFTLASATASATDFSFTIINSVTGSTIEMSIAIIAASLVVMRPCFKSIHRMIFPNQHSHSTQYYVKERSGNQLSAMSQSARENKIGITRTVDIEMESRSVSTEDILRSKDRF